MVPSIATAERASISSRSINFCKASAFEKNKNITILQDFAEEAKIPKKADIITAFMAVRNFDDVEKGIKNLILILKKERCPSQA